MKGSHKEKVCRVVGEELYKINVLIRNLDEIDSDEDGGWKDDKKLVEYLEQKEVEVVS